MMSLSIKLFVVALAVTLAAASLKATTVFPKGWTDLYRAPYQGNPTVMMSLACIEGNLCYAPGATNGQGVNIFKFDGAMNAPWNPMQLDPLGMEIMILAIGAGGSATEPHGLAGGPDLFGGLLFLANATTWASPLALPFTATTSVSTDKQTGLRMMFPDELAPTDSIWISTDGGFTFSSKNVSAPLPTSNCTYARYIANPTPDVIYMTFGNFPNSDKAPRGSESDIARRTQRKANQPFTVQRSERAELQFDGKKGVRYVRHSALEARKERAKATWDSSSSSSSSFGPEDHCGYSAAILKSTDGGSTWRTLLQSTDVWYPNEIACSSATHCVFVGEGDDTGILVFQTTNGEDFQVVMHVPNNATEVRYLQTVAISPANPDIIFVAGGMQTQAGGDEGIFYGSEDGGTTWVEHQKVNFVAEVMQVSFGQDGTAFAVAETEFQASTILRYNPNGPPMTPAPAYLGNFTQKVCNQSSPCDQGCSITSLPQNTCLQMEGGGSLMNSCDMQDQVLLQKAFILSNSCEGPAEEQVAPLGVCLNGQGNSLEFYCGGSSSSNDASVVDAITGRTLGFKAKGIRK